MVNRHHAARLDQTENNQSERCHNKQRHLKHIGMRHRFQPARKCEKGGNHHQRRDGQPERPVHDLVDENAAGIKGHPQPGDKNRNQSIPCQQSTGTLAESYADELRQSARFGPQIVRRKNERQKKEENKGIPRKVGSYDAGRVADAARGDQH